jgi:guanine deaminase
MIKKLLFVIGVFSLNFLSIATAESLYVHGAVLEFYKDPGQGAQTDSYHYFPDGLLIVQDGHIKQAGDYNTLKRNIPEDAKIVNYPNGLIVPGFIDTHIHYPQTDIIAADNGGQLLDWLNKYIFPTENKMKNKQYAEDTAHFFINELLRNGTTTANVFTSIYPQSVDALFTAADQKHMRIIAGLVLMDRNVPAYLTQKSTVAIAQSEALIKKWHEKPGTRLIYAIEVRFAPTTTPALFEQAEALKKRYPTVHVHTHVSENKAEVTWVKQLFHVKNYLDVYQHYNLLGPNTLLAHGIWLTAPELQEMAKTKTSVAFCPTSNLFLGSGLFNLAKVTGNHITVGLGTDVGAGTSFSLLQTLNEAYKVLQMQQQTLTGLRGFYLATLGGAKALNLEDKLGNFVPGKEADFVVLNLDGATPLLKRRLSYTDTLEQKLFVLMMLGDDRSVMATYVDGKLVYQS